MTRIHPAVVVVLAVAVVGLGVAIVVVRNDANSSVSALRHQLGAVQRQEAQLSGGSGANQSVTARVARLDSQLAKLRQCIPELQTEVNGLAIDTTGGSATISNNQQVSSFCQTALNGPARGG